LPPRNRGSTLAATDDENLPEWAWGETDVDKGMLIPRTIDGVYRSIADRLQPLTSHHHRVEDETAQQPVAEGGSEAKPKKRPWVRERFLQTSPKEGDHLKWEQDSVEVRVIRLEKEVSNLQNTLAGMREQMSEMLFMQRELLTTVKDMRSSNF